MRSKLVLVLLTLAVAFGLLAIVTTTPVHAQDTAVVTIHVTATGSPSCGASGGYGNVVIQDRATLQIWQGKTNGACDFSAIVPVGHWYNYGTWMDGNQSGFSCLQNCSVTNFYVPEWGQYFWAGWQCLWYQAGCPLPPTATPTPNPGVTPTPTRNR